MVPSRSRVLPVNVSPGCPATITWLRPDGSMRTSAGRLPATLPSMETVSELSGLTVRFSGESPAVKSKVARVFTSVTTGFGDVSVAVDADADGVETRTAAVAAIAAASLNRLFRRVAVGTAVEVSMECIALFLKGATVVARGVWQERSGARQSLNSAPDRRTSSMSR